MNPEPIKAKQIIPALYEPVLSPELGEGVIVGLSNDLTEFYVYFSSVGEARLYFTGINDLSFARLPYSFVSQQAANFDTLQTEKAKMFEMFLGELLVSMLKQIYNSSKNTPQP